LIHAARHRFGCALVALLFVAVSIGASFLTPERSTATRTFVSPVVFHFSTLLLISLVALVPLHRPHRSRRAWLHHRRFGRSRPRLGHRCRRPVRIPLAAYLAMLAAAGLVFSPAALGGYVLAAAVLLHLAINIRNAWDLRLAFARQIASKRSDT